ncbi:Dam family site-specific DNA-(adenine-N6)-methyltransferase [Deltaproteobacteria bacterium IMCC39524]|nr:Dam family site-specific DNA-(adenine-N6)-methyltransferase [Deltaproteobacteria bacterium IMCC39524]
MKSNMTTQNGKIAPFLKWAGGKRWLVKLRDDLLDTGFNRYVEPFLGSGAVFFHVNPTTSILNDKNKALIDVYRAIKNDHSRVLYLLNAHSKKHSKEYYYEMRAKKCRNQFSKAAQFIYLNRTCWNGLYRVNLKGDFNVPKGTKDKVLLDTDNFAEIANLLHGAQLEDGDFEKVIDSTVEGDLVFIDPPYTANHNNNGFLKYNEHIFSWKDQIRLRDATLKAKNRGAKIILTNANHGSVRELYSRHFNLQDISRASVLSGKKEYRGAVQELLITS